MPNPYHPRIVDDQFQGWGWFYVPEWNLSIAAPPKAGSSSLKRFFTNNDIDCMYLKHSNVPESSDKFFVVRNPFDRFASLWRSKCRDKRNIKDKDVYGMSPRALVAHISSGKKDIHWTKQSDLIGNKEVTLIPLEKLNDWWRDNGYGELEVYNKTSGTMQTNQLIHEWLCNHYAEDFMLYTKACGFN